MTCDSKDPEFRSGLGRRAEPGITGRTQALPRKERPPGCHSVTRVPGLLFQPTGGCSPSPRYAGMWIKREAPMRNLDPAGRLEGCLVSLDYNHGTAMSGDVLREMRAIQVHL